MRVSVTCGDTNKSEWHGRDGASTLMEMQHERPLFGDQLCSPCAPLEHSQIRAFSSPIPRIIRNVCLLHARTDTMLSILEDRLTKCISVGNAPRDKIWKFVRRLWFRAWATIWTNPSRKWHVEQHRFLALINAPHHP
jgi:hypothetical protein